MAELLLSINAEYLRRLRDLNLVAVLHSVIRCQCSTNPISTCTAGIMKPGAAWRLTDGWLGGNWAGRLRGSEGVPAADHS